MVSMFIEVCGEKGRLISMEEFVEDIEKQMTSKHVDITIAIRELAEDHMKNNPEMSSGTIVELLMEGIQEDVFDGWDPDSE